MKKLIATFATLCICIFLNAQNTNIEQATSIRADGAQPDSSAMLDVQSEDRGVLVPRMNSIQREAIANPANGLLVYDSGTGSFWYFEAGFWNEVAVSMAAEEFNGSRMPALTIPDADPNGIKDTIEFDGEGTLDPNWLTTVCVDITHPFTADLDIRLVAPDGTGIDLSSDNGGSGDNYSGSCFSTAASAVISSGSAPFTGSWLPEQSFSNLFSTPIDGNWVLMVSDDAGGDVGILNHWSIEILRRGATPSFLSDVDMDTRIQMEAAPDEDIIRFRAGGKELVKMAGDSVSISTSLNVNNKVGINLYEPPSHYLTVSSPDLETMRLIGPNNFGHGARLNFGDQDYVYIEEPTDDAMRIQANRVGIGRNPVTNDLELEGSASKSVAGDWLANSDARLKKNMRPMDSELMLQKILALRGITYEWNDDKTGSQRPEGIHYGFTAQNIQEAFPALVEEDALGYLQTAYGTLDAMTVEAIRALYKRIETLENENRQLTYHNAGLMERLELLEEAVFRSNER